MGVGFVGALIVVGGMHELMVVENYLQYMYKAPVFVMFPASTSEVDTKGLY